MYNYEMEIKSHLPEGLWVLRRLGIIILNNRRPKVIKCWTMLDSA
jgi:hypothetical protein